MSVQQRRKYDPDFKRNAVQLAEEPGRIVVDVAESLGISNQQQKIRELEKRLKDTEMERDILKKAMAIFSRASK